MAKKRRLTAEILARLKKITEAADVSEVGELRYAITARGSPDDALKALSLIEAEDGAYELRAVREKRSRRVNGDFYFSLSLEFVKKN